MKKLVLLSLAALPLFAAAQVPSYVPTNGLVGWWPFNGNANDESGNGNNGTVNGATLTTDRNGNVNAAYSFDGLSSFIEIGVPQTPAFSMSIWFNNSLTSGISGIVQHKDNCSRGGGYILEILNNSIRYTATNCGQCFNSSCANFFDRQNVSPIITSQWYLAVLTCDNNATYKLFINGSVVDSIQNFSTISQYNVPFSIGKHHDGVDLYFFQGKLDDIGIWNRALTSQEISALYNGCGNSIITQPSNQSIAIGNSAVFATNSSDPNATYQWQTDLGLGFQNLSNAGQYSGVTTNTLNVNSVNAGNNNQAFRCIVSSGSCTDTTSAAYITITTGITENTSYTFTIFPNPANNTITVSWSTADSKALTLRDAAGRVVRTYNVNGTQAQLSLEGLASGVYFLSVGGEEKMVQKIIKD